MHTFFLLKKKAQKKMKGYFYRQIINCTWLIWLRRQLNSDIIKSSKKKKKKKSKLKWPVAQVKKKKKKKKKDLLGSVFDNNIFFIKGSSEEGKGWIEYIK